MKKLSILVLAIAMVLGISQCKKKETPTTHDTPVVSNWVRITMRVGGGGREMDTVYPGTGAVVYEEGDIIYVGNTGKYRGKLEYHNGAFSGLVADPEETDYLHFYYLGKLTPSAPPAINETTNFTVSIADQSATLPIISYGHSTTRYSDGIPSYVCMLENKCGLVKFMAWPTPSTTNTAVTISGMKTTATISFGDNPGITTANVTGAVTLHKVKNSDPAERWAILLPQNEADAMVSYINGTTGNPIAQTITLPAIEANCFYGGYHGISVGLEYVDLGLSSGRKWAACNIGSCTHEGFGTFFAWAETEPKSTYCWHSYKYAFNPKFYPDNPSSEWITAEGSGYSSDDTLHHEPGSNGKPNLGFFKYNTKAAYFAYEGGAVTGPNGVVEGPDGVNSIYVIGYDDDNLPIDDAAYVNWGKDWRIPTAQEWRDLLNETTKTREVVNGVGGVRFTGQNGNSIFLPFAGVYGGPMHSFYYGCGNQPHGEYWSNEIDTIRPYQAYILYFDDKDHAQDPGTFPDGIVGGEIVFHNSGGDDVIEFIRNQGRPVRAVYDPDGSKK